MIGRRRAGWWGASAVAVAMLALSAGAAKTAAAAGDEELRAQIPFSFTVNRASLPPGSYRVTIDNAQGMIEIRDMGHGAFAVGIPFDDSGAQGAKLVFHRYGDQYVLREVWTGTGTGRDLPEPRREKELASATTRGPESARFERVEVPVM